MSYGHLSFPVRGYISIENAIPPPNHIVRRTFTCNDLSKGKSSHVILLFSLTTRQQGGKKRLPPKKGTATLTVIEKAIFQLRIENQACA
jgi:hypothetical protein